MSSWWISYYDELPKKPWDNDARLRFVRVLRDDVWSKCSLANFDWKSCCQSICGHFVVESVLLSKLISNLILPTSNIQSGDVVAENRKPSEANVSAAAISEDTARHQ